MTGRIRNLEDFRQYLREGMRRHLRAKGVPEDELEAHIFEIMVPDEEESPITVQFIPRKPKNTKGEAR